MISKGDLFKIVTWDQDYPSHDNFIAWVNYAIATGQVYTASSIGEWNGIYTVGLVEWKTLHDSGLRKTLPEHEAPWDWVPVDWVEIVFKV